MKNKEKYLRTRSGKMIDVLNPKPYDFVLSDIVLSLVDLPRYCNQLKTKYTVLAHSVYAAKIALKLTGSKELAKACLLHDASEAYLNDVPKPVKNYCKDYLKIEKKFMKAICERFGIDIKMLKEVDKYDKMAYYAEQRDLTENIYQPFADKEEIVRKTGEELIDMFYDLCWIVYE